MIIARVAFRKVVRGSFERLKRGVNRAKVCPALSCHRRLRIVEIDWQAAVVTMTFEIKFAIGRASSGGNRNEAGS